MVWGVKREKLKSCWLDDGKELLTALSLSLGHIWEMVNFFFFSPPLLSMRREQSVYLSMEYNYMATAIGFDFRKKEKKESGNIYILDKYQHKLCRGGASCLFTREGMLKKV